MVMLAVESTEKTLVNETDDQKLQPAILPLRAAA
jgi:hypothetical protein